MDLGFASYDIIFAGIILISVVLALLRGGVAELLSLSTWFIAIFVMRKYSHYLTPYLPDIISNPLLRALISYIIAFFIVACFMAILKRLLAQFIQTLGLGGLNYLLGALFGLVRGVIICALIIIIIKSLGFDKQPAWHNSKLNPLLTPVSNTILQAIPADFKNVTNQNIESNVKQLYLQHESSIKQQVYQP